MADRAALPITGDDDADRLLEDEPLALMIGMLLDQQVPMEWAFGGPHRLKQRLGDLDAKAIADTDVDELEMAFKEKPALHRFPGSMARRAHEMCRQLVEQYGGDPTAIWSDGAPAGEVLARLKALPGYGDEKSRIFLALLAKRFGIRPAGWEMAAAPFSDGEHRSVADIDSAEALEKVRQFKKAMKAKGKGKGG
jgi:uncharacterized HhH-GPD family protein